MRTRSALIAVALLCACALPGAHASDDGHDDDDHVPGACREFGYPEAGWQLDEDCCAPYLQSACEDGYDHEVTEEVCFQSGDCVAYRTMCTPSDDEEKVTMSEDVQNYECEPNLTGVIIFFAVVVPLAVTSVPGCYLTKTCCFQYRRREQFMAWRSHGRRWRHTDRLRGPQYGVRAARRPDADGGPPQYGQPAPQGYVVHQATVRPMQTPDAQPSAGPYAGPGSQDPGIVRQSKVPVV